MSVRVCARTYEGLFLRIYFQWSVIRTFDEVARRRLLSFPSQFSLIDRKAGGWVCQNGPASLDDTPPSSASSQNRQDVGRPPPPGGRGAHVSIRLEHQAAAPQLHLAVEVASLMETSKHHVQRAGPGTTPHRVATGPPAMRVARRVNRGDGSARRQRHSVCAKESQQSVGCDAPTRQQVVCPS